MAARKRYRFRLIAEAPYALEPGERVTQETLVSIDGDARQMVTYLFSAAHTVANDDPAAAELLRRLIAVRAVDDGLELLRSNPPLSRDVQAILKHPTGDTQALGRWET